MKRITFYLDFVSPYAWLAFDALPRALQGLSYEVRYRPVLLNTALKERFGYTPRKTSAQAFGAFVAARDAQGRPVRATP